MNDRFKFRVWWEKVNRYRIDAKIHPIEKFFRKGFIIEQCTGLRDKNGNLIYEGDVVRMSGRVLAVWWDCDCACWMLGANEIGGYFPSQLEIIGNIHEQKDAA